MAELIRADGIVKDVQPGNGVAFTLEELQVYVGGYIELVPGSLREKPAFCNEDGLRLGLLYNPLASMRYGVNLVGTVLVCDTLKQAGGDE